MKLDNTISQLCSNRFPAVNDTVFKQWIIDFAKEVNFTPGLFVTILSQPGNQSLISFPENGRQILDSIKVDGKSVLEIDFVPINGVRYDQPSVKSSTYVGMHGYVMSVALSETGIELARHYLASTINQAEVTDKGFMTFIKNVRQIISKVWRNLKGFLAGMAVMASIFGFFQTFDSPTFQKILSTIVQK